MKADKSPIKLRRKKLKNGVESLYLDIYYDGKRSYEYLKLYITKATTPEERDINKRTLLTAEQIKSKRLIELMEKKDEFFNTSKSQRYHIADYIQHINNKYYNRMIYPITINNCNVLLSELKTQQKLDSFIEQSFHHLSRSTKEVYKVYMSSIIKSAQRDGFLPKSLEIHSTKVETKREFLTLDEIKKLHATPCKSASLKNAFLFSCFTGLRISDVMSLQWKDITQIEGYTRITFTQTKTKNLEYMDISDQAVMFLDNEEKIDDYVFHFQKWSINRHIRRWVKNAGIDKKITFHCARHTFAILMIELGTDLFVVSKLLGHREIKTTQIYAKVLDKTKRAAIDKIPKIM